MLVYRHRCSSIIRSCSHAFTMPWDIVKASGDSGQHCIGMFAAFHIDIDIEHMHFSLHPVAALSTCLFGNQLCQ